MSPSSTSSLPHSTPDAEKGVERAPSHGNDDATLSSPDSPKAASVSQQVNKKHSVMPTVPLLLKAGLVTIVAFWINALWLFGSFWNSSERVHQLKVIVADFDGGEVGAAMLAAVAKVNGLPSQPSFHIYNASTTTAQAILDEVYAGKAWGAFYATQGASDRFTAALAANSTSAASYVASQALVYTGLEVRYAAVWSGYLLTSFLALEQSTMAIFTQQVMVPLSKTLDTASLSAAQAGIFFAPISANFINLTPFTFTAKTLYNTIGTVLPVLFQFFFLMTLNGVYNAHGLYGKVSHRHMVLARWIKGSIWTLVASLCVVGWEVAFDEGLGLKAKNFFALWASTWFFAMGLFDLLDTVTSFVPLPLQVPVILSIIIMSVASTAWPIELCNHFFRIHYAFPAHAMWETNMTAWSGGAANKLYYDLPVLAVWAVIGKVLVVFAMKKKIADARKANGSSQ